jgi:toxin CcdB
LAQQYDIVENLHATSRRAYPYLIVLQHDRAEMVSTIVTAPVAPWSELLATSRMHPEIAINGRRHLLLVEQLASVPRRALGPPIASAEAHDYEITAALDMLFTGI